jgi:hypothetical protein
MLCRMGGLIHLLTSALTASPYRRIDHDIKTLGLWIKWVTIPGSHRLGGGRITTPKLDSMEAAQQGAAA